MASEPKHKRGSSIHDLVVQSSVHDGIGISCGSCKRPFMVRAPRGQFTRPDEFPSYWCPYCGYAAESEPLDPHMRGRITDIRPVGND